MKLFTTEQVSKYHPDKYADQISDALLTAYLRKDKNARCGIEVMVKDYTIVIAGEVTSTATVDVESVARYIAKKLRYRVDRVINLISKQSIEIGNAVSSDENIGAGDQGIMFGYATSETKDLMPYGFDIANKIIKTIEIDVEFNKFSVLKGDAKTQVTVDLDTNKLHTIVISACHIKSINHDDLRFYILKLIEKYQPEILDIKKWIDKKVNMIINPAGTWTIGGAVADAGLTGRKIVCDQYGGYIAVGGGAFSGKDPTKVDRSATYMARRLALDVIKEFKVKWCEVQLSYAIGIAKPVSIFVKTNKSRKEKAILKFINKNYDLTPRGIIERLNLLEVNYDRVARGCHFYGNESWQTASTISTSSRK